MPRKNTLKRACSATRPKQASPGTCSRFLAQIRNSIHLCVQNDCSTTKLFTNSWCKIGSNSRFEQTRAQSTTHVHLPICFPGAKHGPLVHKTWVAPPPRHRPASLCAWMPRRAIACGAQGVTFRVLGMEPEGESLKESHRGCPGVIFPHFLRTGEVIGGLDCRFRGWCPTRQPQSKPLTTRYLREPGPRSLRPPVTQFLPIRSHESGTPKQHC